LGEKALMVTSLRNHRAPVCMAGCKAAALMPFGFTEVNSIQAHERLKDSPRAFASAIS